MTIEQRMERVELSMRRWRAGAMAASVALAAAVALGAQRQPSAAPEDAGPAGAGRQGVMPLLVTRGLQVVNEQQDVVFSIKPVDRSGLGGAVMEMRVGGAGGREWGEFVVGPGEHGPLVGVRARNNEMAAWLEGVDGVGGRLTLFDAKGEPVHTLPPKPAGR